jgi:hypothetical protein
MSITHLRPPSAKVIRKSVPADFADNACAQGLTVCRAHLLIIASHLPETGRLTEARVLTDAAAKVQGVERDIVPPALPTSTANECLERS